MSQIRNPNLQRTIDLNYANKKRSNSLKWSIINGTLLLLFVYDLSCKCEGYTSVLHYVELLLAAVAGANLVQHALRLRPAMLSSHQPHLLHASVRTVTPECSYTEQSLDSSAEADTLSLSMSPRAWRSASASPALHSPPTSSPASHSPPSSSPTSHSPPHSSPRRERPEHDEFIADHHALAQYLRQRAGVEQRSRASASASWAAPLRAPSPWAAPPPYLLATLDAECGAGEAEEGVAGVASVAGEAADAGSPHLWRRLRLDPRQLTQYNLNLRLWIHVTILERVVREMDAADAALAAQGLEARVGEVGLERLRAHAASAGPLAALLPYLAPFADQRYVARRLRRLARGGCLGDYRWRGGGADWHEARPTDAELLLHLLAAYLDAQLPPGARAFSAAHVSAAPAPAPRGAHVLALRRVRARPPHYVLLRGDEALEVGAGRNNLLHALLLFVAASAARRPPAICRLHMGPAGLNMLWIIGR